MTPEAKEFMEKNPPKYKLKKYSEDIVGFLKEGYTQAEIIRYLKECHDLKVSHSTLKRQINHIKKTNSKTIPVRTEPKASESEEPKTIKKPSQAKDYSLPKTLNGEEFVAKVKSMGQGGNL